LANVIKGVSKKSFESKKKGRRTAGKCRLRWVKDGENDLWELQVKKWRQKANNREEWTLS
jgi:hypothetical protein